MKFALLFSVLASLIVAPATVRAESVAKPVTGSCSDESVMELVRAAKKSISKHAIEIEGVNGVGISLCDPFYIAQTLGMPHAAVALPPVCGVRIGFEKGEQELNFARAMRILGNTVTVMDKEGDRHEVTVCATTLGTIRAGSASTPAAGAETEDTIEFLSN